MRAARLALIALALTVTAPAVWAGELYDRARAEYEAGKFEACNDTYRQATTKGEIASRLDKRSMAACHCGADDVATIAQGLRELEALSNDEPDQNGMQITNALIAMCTTLLNSQSSKP